MTFWRLTTPFPCPFCSGDQLKIIAVVFRTWYVKCSHCGATGPLGQTPDGAVLAWNSTKNRTLQQRKSIDMSRVNQSKIDKMWKACRAMRTFTVNEIMRLTGIEHRDTVRKYLYLLEQCDYLRIETQKECPGAPNIYRVVRQNVVKAPEWNQLRYPQADQAIRRENVRFLKPIKVSAINN
jgi:hypothetical protein